MHPDYTYQATILRVVDGDTVRVRVDLGLRVSTEITVRLMGINAPELNTDAGKQSREYLRLLEGQPVVLKTHKDPKDKYGRWLGEIYCNGDNINSLMVVMGYAVRMK